MLKDGVIRSTCELCNSGCGVLVHMKDGKPVKVEGDPENPINQGALCVKGKASLEYLNHPDRLKYPLKRTGERGKGEWQQITWDEAMHTIVAELNKAKEQYGAESTVFIRGCAKGLQDGYLHRFANAFGSPNAAAMGSICHFPRQFSSMMTYGYWATPDYEHPPACIIMWGQNQKNTAIGEHRRAIEAISKGSKLIVIDPWETGYAKRADIWVRSRPCSDLALALGMLNVIINEGLYDRDFVENWTIGFDRLKSNVQKYSPEQVSEITWVSAETIKEAARLYATSKPACIVWGNGNDHNLNNFQTYRAISSLRAITGNLGKPGGEIDWAPSGIVLKGSSEIAMPEALPKEIHAKRLSADDGILPVLPYTLPQTIVKSLLKGKPYPIHLAFVQGASLLHTYSHAKETCEALKNLDFLIVTDFFMTPTAALADIVLPVATFLEIDSLHQPETSTTVSIIQKVAQVGECWSDYKILSELAKRLGLGSYFWEAEEQALDFILKPTGLTFDDFRKTGILPGRKLYRHYENKGFATPSGKVELYSKRLEEWGFDPLPVYREPAESPYSEPELAKEYPLILSDRKFECFQHSGGRQIPSLRNSHPEPLVWLHPETASKLGIVEGDWVYIETRRGRIRQKASFSSSLDPRVVMAEFGWWFPEKGAAEMYGWAESNFNILTDNKPPYARELGSATLRNILCKVYKEN
jgi:anaerobic selenocysteine-containing dehydrogenase